MFVTGQMLEPDTPTLGVLFDWFEGPGYGTKGLERAKQVLYHWAITSLQYESSSVGNTRQNKASTIEQLVFGGAG